MSLLADDWLAWVAASLLQDETVESICAVLVERGLTPEQAMAEVDSVRADRFFQVAQGVVRPHRLVQRLRQAHLRLGERMIPRRRLCATDFMADHVVSQQPVVLADFAAGWPASAWTWDDLVAAHGEIRVNACVGRTRATDPNRDWKPLETELSFADLVARIRDPDTGDDVVVMANNQALEGPLAPLLADVAPVPGFLPEARLVETSTWIGGAGARTPLHHDTSDILLCPFLGRKHLWMVPPEEIDVTAGASKFWAPDTDLDDPELAVREAVVEPGDAILIPSGWWHAVQSVEPNITLTFAGLAHRNTFAWYRPGFREA